MKNFRLMMSFIIILFSIVLVSEGIIISHYGIPPYEFDPVQFKEQFVDIYKRFFRKVHQQDSYVYKSQRSLGVPTEFPVIKTSNTIRVFLIGGSVGELFNGFLLKSNLGNLISDKNFEVINCSVSGYDSYREILVLKEILFYKPDLVIVFSGNNEHNFVNNVKVNLWAYYTNKLLRRFWIYRKSQDRFSKWRIEQGLVNLRNNVNILTNFEKNIRSMARMTKAKRIPIMLCTLPLNIRDCPPGGERPPEKRFLLGLFLLEKKDYLDAIAEFSNFLKDNPNNAFGFYFLGRAYDALGIYAKAEECYLRAVRACYPERNIIIRRVCAEEGTLLVDLDLAFMNLAPHGLMGQEQFIDYCHWFPGYNSLVTEVIIQVISQDVTARSTMFNSARHKLDSLSFSHNFPLSKERGERDSIWKLSAAVTAALNVQTVSERAIAFFEQLYSMNPGLLLRLKYSEDSIKRELKSSWIQQSILETHWWPRVLCHVAETYRRLGLYKESLEYFSEAISLGKQDFYQPYIGRALTYYLMDDKQKAKEDIDRAVEISGNSLEVRYYKEILEN